MWISAKKYESLWEEKYQLQKDKDLLVRLLSALILSQDGEVTISMPSTDSRTLHWKDNDDGSLTMKSEVYNLKDGTFKTS